MPLSAGSWIGRYEIRGTLGAGGMGEVYRARDPRLDRDVALKLLPRAAADEPARLHRFEREAHLLSRLTHPNIVTVYEVGEADGVSYISMELVDGRSLRAVMDAGPLDVRRLLDVSCQISSGLACAHGAGVIHRDLKPENVMVSRDGAAKILDFGLAKRLTFEGGAAPFQPTLTDVTDVGVIVGTVGYMSPEQARGHAVDFRSDQFSFGSILYELATARRAFDRPSRPETLSAIIREQPEPITSVNPVVPAPLGWIVERCLAKDPAGRYASTEDLTRELAVLRDHIVELRALTGGPAIHHEPQRLRRAQWLTTGIALGALGVAAVAWLGRPGPSHDLPTFRQLTYRAGIVNAAAFMPDQSTVLYAAAWEGHPRELFMQRLGSPESRPLGISANLFGLSATGEMALSLHTRLFEPWADVGTLARMQVASGAAPREVLEDVQWASWSPDGNDFAIVHEAAGRSTLEYPIGTVQYRGAGFLSHPRVAPDGSRVAFLDHPVRADDAGKVVVVDRRGATRVLLDGLQSVYGLGWSSEGNEVWFTGTSRGTSRALHAVDLTGHDRVVSRVIGSMLLQDISRSGNALLVQDSRTQHVRGLAPAERTERELSWLDYSLSRAISADGKRVLFVEGGEAEGPLYGVYLRGTDGSPAVRLGDGDAQALSPDGRWAAAIVREADGARLVLYPTGPGQARRLSVGSVRLQRADWIPGGRHLLLSGTETGHATRLYTLDLTGGAVRSLSPEGYVAVPGTISPDGTRVVAIDPRHHFVVFPLQGGPPTTLPDNAGSPIGWTSDGTRLYIALPYEAGETNDSQPGPRRIAVLNVATGSIIPWKTLGNEDGATAIHISPDGQAYVYSFVHQQGTLYLAVGLR